MLMAHLNFRATLILVLLCFLLPFKPVCAVESVWSMAHGPFFHLQEVIYGDNRYLAVGDCGILFSDDGNSWDFILSYDEGLNSIAWNGNMYVAVGSRILTSPDGINWTEGFFDDNRFTGVAWGNGQFVVVSYSGTIYTSTDGENWIKQQSGATDTLLHVEYGQGEFVAVGYGIILTSPDGHTWTEKETSLVLSSVRWLNGRYFAVGKGLLTSTDGKTWQQRDSQFDSYLNDIVWNGSQYIAVGSDGSIFVSTDSIVWTKNPDIWAPLSSLTWGQDQFVAVGRGTILTSPNGSNWQVILSELDKPLYSVAWGDNQFIALGETVYSSSNGLNWTEVDWHWDSSRPLRGVAWGLDRWVAAGWSDYEYTGYIYTSDGDKLLETGIAVSDLPFIEDVIWASDKFIAIGYGEGVYVSSDGLSWTEQKIGATCRLLSIVEGNNLLVAIGESGAIVTSTDGITWSKMDSGTGERLNKVTWGGNQYVAVGDKGTILSSPDGVNWTAQDSGTDVFLNSVAWGNGAFVIVGSQGTILVSADGKNWYASPSGVKFWLNDVAWNQNSFVVGGEYGSLLYAPADKLAELIPAPNPGDVPRNQANPHLPIIFGVGAMVLIAAACILIVANKKSKGNGVVR